MQFRYTIPALAMALALAACAAHPPVQTTAPSIVCDNEVPINPQASMCNQREE